MAIKSHIARALLVAFMLTSPAQMVSADDDHIEARRLLDAGKILPLESILINVRNKFPGRILEVKLEREHRKIVYEVEVLGDNGIVTEVYIDAESGKVLSSKEDD